METRLHLSRIFFSLFLPACCLHAQAQSRYKGLGIEAGLGYNTASWEYSDSRFNHLFDASLNRNKLWLQPALRIHYNIRLLKFFDRDLMIQPFAGYYTFGGSSRIEANGYRDKYIFRSMEFGLAPGISFHDKFQLSVAYKNQYILEARGKYYGSLSQPDSIPRSWNTHDADSMFVGFAGSAGIMARYKWRHFTLGAEAWFGITNLNTLKSPGGKLTVKENNFRIMLGYEL